MFLIVISVEFQIVSLIFHIHTFLNIVSFFLIVQARKGRFLKTFSNYKFGAICNHQSILRMPFLVVFYQIQQFGGFSFYGTFQQFLSGSFYVQNSKQRYNKNTRNFTNNWILELCIAKQYIVGSNEFYTVQTLEIRKFFSANTPSSAGYVIKHDG